MRVVLVLVTTAVKRVEPIYYPAHNKCEAIKANLVPRETTGTIASPKFGLIFPATV